MTSFRADPVDLDAIRSWREHYRQEMTCQIIHDSIHDRRGWTREFRLSVGETSVGYGSVAVAGPWSKHPTIYEIYVVPEARCSLFELFEAFAEASGAERIEIQSNDSLANTVFHEFACDVESESILFEDVRTTTLEAGGAAIRQPHPDEFDDVAADQLHWHAVLERDGQVIGKGGILRHYNPPYGDIFIDVDEPFRRRGFGSYLVQELKRICYEEAHVPAARCKVANEASRRTLQRAGFAPCGHILIGRLK